MATTDNLRNLLIEKIMSIRSLEFLKALDKIIDSAHITDDLPLTKEQILMLKMSDSDITNRKVFDQNELDKDDLKWLKGK